MLRKRFNCSPLMSPHQNKKKAEGEERSWGEFQPRRKGGGWKFFQCRKENIVFVVHTEVQVTGGLH